MQEAEAIRLLDKEWIRLTEIRNRLTWQRTSIAHERGDPADAARELLDDEEQTSALAEVERALADVDRAYERLRSERYGKCQACGGDIDDERLRARPAARFCARDEQQREGFATA
jgi:RNA polymerase-binding transcription factor DksA